MILSTLQALKRAFLVPTHLPLESVIAGLSVIKFHAAEAGGMSPEYKTHIFPYVGEEVTCKRDCPTCAGGPRIFVKWFDEEFWCLNELFKMRNIHAKLGCMKCKKIGYHFANPAGEMHCAMCWISKRQAAKLRRRQVIPAVSLPAAASAAAASPDLRIDDQDSVGSLAPEPNRQDAAPVS